MKGMSPSDKFWQKPVPQRLENRCHKLQHTADRYVLFKAQQTLNQG